MVVGGRERQSVPISRDVKVCLCLSITINARTEAVPADVDLPLAQVVVRDKVERGVDGLADGAEGAAEAGVDEALVFCGYVGVDVCVCVSIGGVSTHKI